MIPKYYSGPATFHLLEEAAGLALYQINSVNSIVPIEAVLWVPIGSKEEQKLRRCVEMGGTMRWREGR